MAYRSNFTQRQAHARLSRLHPSFSESFAAESGPVLSQRNLFLALPEELYAEARETARLRQISVSDLLIEALSMSIEAQNQRNWQAEQATATTKGPARVH